VSKDLGADSRVMPSADGKLKMFAARVRARARTTRHS
jgi:hypothetical protein